MPLSASILAASIISEGCDRNEGWQRSSGAVWNTLYNVTWHGPAALADSILPALRPVDESLSVFNDSSIVSRVNSNLITEVDDHFKLIYTLSYHINSLSRGAFDPTLEPAIEAWGFGRSRTPSADTLRCDSLRRFVGITRTRLVGDSLIKHDIRTRFNFSAIAKGYGCDLVAAMLKRNGVTDFLVEIGGEVVCRGSNHRATKWQIAIDAPEENREGLPRNDRRAETVSLTDMALATSGNYRNFHTSAGGGNFGHTISAQTCRPARTDVISATVAAKTCMEADALATTLMAIGSGRAKALCEKTKTPAMLILADSSRVYLQDFQSLITR